jgi:hypothetical protein
LEASRLTAIGGVLLAAAVAISDIRLEQSWARGVHFAVVGVGFAIVYVLGLVQPSEEDGRPTAEQSALLAASLVLLVFTVVRFGDVVVGGGSEHSGTLTWMALVYAALAAYPAVRKRSAVCALAAAAAVGIAIGEFVSWVSPGDVQVNGARWILFGLILLYALGAFALRNVRPRHGAQLVNTAMLAVIGIVGTVGAEIVFADEEDNVPHLSTWWEIVAFVVAVAGIVFAIRSRERGPAWTAGAALLFAIATIGSPFGQKATFVGWPLVFLVLALLTLAAGAAHRLRSG